MSNHNDPIDYSFTLVDDTGRRRLSDEQRLRLHIAMESEGEVLNDMQEVATRLALIADRAQAPGAEEEASSVAQRAGLDQLRNAAEGELAGRVLGSEEVTV